jgi:hypothetical protein
MKKIIGIEVRSCKGKIRTEKDTKAKERKRKKIRN